MNTAELAYLAVKANSVARVDLRYDPETNRLVVLEINTIPGLTPTSFTPLAMKSFLGLDFKQTIAVLINDGIEYY